MTADEYLNALFRLGLSQVGAAAVLGVTRRTAQNYAAFGVSGPAEAAVRLLLLLKPRERAAFIGERTQ